MIVRLFCPVCAYNVAQKKLATARIEVPLPVSRVSDDGTYEVRCSTGHASTVILDNLRFELLFEMALNALVDGYPREAVSSFASSLERFHESYWRVVMNHLSVPPSEVEASWKALSKQSERQLGAFVVAHLVLTKTSPTLLNPNKEVAFRNKVIHSGYVPTHGEAVSFGDSVMLMIREALEELRACAPEAMLATYKEMSPAPEERNDGSDASDEMRGVVNIPTAIDVRHPPSGDDRRVGGVEAQFPRIIHERQAFGMELFSEEEFKKRFPDLKPP